MIILFKDRNFEIDYENNDWYFDMKKYLPQLQKKNPEQH